MDIHQDERVGIEDRPGSKIVVPLVLGPQNSWEEDGHSSRRESRNRGWAGISKIVVSLVLCPQDSCEECHCIFGS